MVEMYQQGVHRKQKNFECSLRNKSFGTSVSVLNDELLLEYCYFLLSSCINRGINVFFFNKTGILEA